MIKFFWNFIILFNNMKSVKKGALSLFLLQMGRRSLNYVKFWYVVVFENVTIKQTVLVWEE